MFTCFWKMWDWLDPKSMENKKPFIENQGPRNNESPGAADLGPSLRGPLMKRQVNTAPQHFRMIQYGMKPSAYTNCQTAVHQQPPQIVQPPGIWAPVSIQQQQQQQQQPINVNSHATRLIPNSTPTTPDNQKLAVKPFEPVADAKKKINANSPQLRSPSAKRLTHGTVTMQGWLHKQGSEGLKVWRKRWFVLSDYCLYYYKGPEEEKVLGSILLPSYKVSLCGTDDKVYRKFAFKCEHANMRTYYLAADSQELMMNWIRALNLACILQTNVESDRQSGPSVSSMYNPSLENSDSGFHQQYNVHNNVHVHMHSCSNTSGASTSENTVSVSTPSYSLEFGGSGGNANANANTVQPLYANAPPKPRRLTDGGYSSSSPEFLAAERYQQMHQMYGYNVPYRMERACSKSPINNIYVRNCDNRTPNNPPMPYNMANAKQQQLHYNHNHLYEQQMQQATPQQQQHLQQQHLQQQQQQRDNNLERRTPDTYGRSKLNKMKDVSDYEDVYAVDEVIYKRPLSPVAYSNIKKVSPVASITVQHRPYTPVYIAGPPAPEPSFTPTYKMRLSPIPQPETRHHQNTIPRPHSADFLDYEVKHRNSNKFNVANCQQPRPKSSLDITRSPSDNYYYSKESYAENMRKSALYLQQLPNHYHTTRGNENLIILNGQQKGGYHGPNKHHVHEMQSNLRLPGNEKQFINGSEGSLDIDLSSGPYAKSPISHMHHNELGYSNEILNMQRERESPSMRDYHHGEQFKRSASARLLRTPIQSSSEDYYGTVNREGDQKREESMKRLLEWKQRMLQSPLNRKMSSGLVMPRTVLSRPDMYVRSANHPHHSHPHVQIPNEVADARDGRRSYVDAPLPQYSSYSSDDEENDLSRSKKVRGRLLQAGRTKEEHPDNFSLTNSPSLNASTSRTVFDVPLSLNTSSSRSASIYEADSAAAVVVNITETITNNNNMLELTTDDVVMRFTPPANAIPVPSTPPVVPVSPAASMSEQNMTSGGDLAINDNSVTITNTDANLIVCSVRTETTEQLYEDLLIASTKISPIHTEENYITMTPKKSALVPTLKHLSHSSSEGEENAYMEMTKGFGVSLLDQNETSNDNSLVLNGEVQPYEVVCFGDNKIEPVYMELNHSNASNEQSLLVNVNDEDKNGGKTELPDILITPKSKSKNKNTKSDSSDADDEASKDLDSLDAPCHPRFSLSDTFRPASYYLGASRVLTEFHDSSDSELVSPPPIPTSPPPMDDLDHSFFRQERINEECNTSSNTAAEYSFNKNLKISSLSESTVDVSETDDGSRKDTFIKEQDSMSIYSINTDGTSKRYSSRSSHNSDSDVELRTCKNSNYERMLKRRPVSEEFCDELESLDSRFNDSIENVDLDRHLRELSIGGTPKGIIEEKFEFETPQREYENLCRHSDPGLHKSLSQRDLHNTSSISDNNASYHSFTQRSLASSLSVFNSSAPPYYYSDLSSAMTEENNSNALYNNQRTDTNVNKKHIARIINQIHCNEASKSEEDTFKLAAEARSASVDFLNVTEKSGQIDKKNIYESNSLKKASSNMQQHSDAVNLYSTYPSEKQYNVNDCEDVGTTMRRTHSLEGLLKNVLNDTSTNRTLDTSNTDDANVSNTYEGSQIWEEDSLWRERLRSASQRHTRSLDDLDNICTDTTKTEIPSTPKPKLQRDAVYVNDSVLNRCKDIIISEVEYSDSASAHEQESADSTKNEIWNITSNMGTKSKFTIDRETLRQWDLLSSAPAAQNTATNTSSSVTKSTTLPPASTSTCTTAKGMSATSSPVSQGMLRPITVSGVDSEQGNFKSKQIYAHALDHNEMNVAQRTASGSMCMAVHETFPRAISKKMWSSNAITPSRSSAALNITSRPEHDFEQPRSSPSPYLQNPLQSQSLHREMGQHHANLQKAAWQWTDRMNMSAGELLGRTHEELVLLLIQLRRQSTHTCHAIDTCYAEIDNIQSKLNTMDAAKRLENLQKLEQIKQHLIELEKQYEKGKPLVNLVDNMVKLGSLYRNPSDQHYNINVRDRLEFNQQIQEQRLLAEERRDWNRLSPNHMQLQTKVQQLYHLDRLLQEESGTLQCLQHDKEKIERALGGLRLRLNKCHKDPTEIEQARKQQMHLENELSRVHYMLAQNSKKLEETVAGNARLEQELLVLRQKLQLSRQQRSSAQFSNNGAGDSLPCAAGTSAVLEAELHRVQQLVGDLQRQRQELCAQVRQLTDRSHSLSQQIRPSCLTPINVPNNSMNNKKRVSTSWRETDLDTMHSIDHGIDWDPQNRSRPTTPLYVNTDPNKQPMDCYRPEDSYLRMEDNQQNTECIPQEKTEIKTVRIVKRESERRQRDREKTNIISTDNHQLKWDSVVEEDDQGLNSFYIPSTRNEPNINSVFPETPISTHLTVMDKSNNILNRNGSVSSPSLYSQTNSYTSDAQTNSSDALSLDKSPVLSPVFKSEAARQIIIEMSGVQSEPSTLKNSARRAVPKEKRRHYTAPHNNLIMKSLSNFPTDNKSCIDSRRARDDLDMERALRQRTDTPDVVRSTMSSRELKYNENTIDNILGTPNKITIPERYIPEQLPQLSAEEQRQRLRKVESIKKMLSDTTILSSSSSAPPPPTSTSTTTNNTNNSETFTEGGDKAENTAATVAAKASSKIVEEKRQRERLLQLNQILAKQVMEMSKIVAVKALANLPLEPQKISADDEDLSPVTPLPLYQQRDNYYT